MGIFACFGPGRKQAASDVHAKEQPEAHQSHSSLPKIHDADVAEVILEPQETHTASSKLGKPYNVGRHGPGLPANNAARVETVSCILSASRNTDPALAPILQLLGKILNIETVCVTMIVEGGVLVRQGTGNFTEQKFFPESGVCHWILAPDRPTTMIVEDMQLDARTCTQQVVVKAPHMRFYASAPLVASNGHIVGTLCLWDQKPRRFDSNSAAILSNFAELVVRELEMNAVMKCHLSMANMLKRAMDCYQQGYLFVDVAARGWRIMHVNQAFSTCTGLSREAAIDSLFWDLFHMPSSNVQEPWGKHQDSLAEKRPFQLTGLKCTAQTSMSDNSYSALVRPASTDRMDDSAVILGIPAGSFSQDIVPQDDSYFFVVLRAPQEVFRRQISAPIKTLKIGRQLGAGSQGRVYRGTLDGQRVAVKVVDNASTLRKIGTMPLEAALLQDLKHDCIVNLLQHRFVKGACSEQQLWLVMEFCDKGPLDMAISKGMFRAAPTPMAPPCMETILQTALDIAEGMAFLHTRCVVHCDFSGGNILLRTDAARPHGFSAKISDFGMCRIKDMEVQESLQGTYSHMAPEVIEKEEFSEASDVYALGVLLWEMYNGQRAWAGLHFAQLSYAMFVEKRSLQFPDGTPEAFRILASHCLAPLPADRPSSKDLPAMLNQLLADHGEWKDSHSL